MCKDSEENGGGKKKMPAGRIFTVMNAKQAQEASVRARNLRKQMRAKLLDAAIQDGKIDELYVKAIKTRDADLMKLVEQGLKIVGLTHDQSEDAVTKMQIDATTDNKTDVTGKVEFVIAQKQ